MVLGDYMIAVQVDENNIVINRVVVDNINDLPNLIAAGDNAVIGATYDPQQETFSLPDPVIEVPAAVTMAAGKIAMERAEVLSTIDTAINALGGESLMWWNNAAIIKRNFPLVETMRVSQGWTQSYVDQLFITANEIDLGE